ncbi:hypothetical protein [Pandoraea bronchicola]|uniref:Uncharacterized protein n=1 Tax=Pandoraea bronchicola TaxID=2508287 RepID=A0A5E5C1I5_9BURK|nr:hypothetical protein [Pandoraea bronchicola]VVE90423.1 hypothetical protein PBR20603_04407 [Pandoraea bronchicola]
MITEQFKAKDDQGNVYLVLVHQKAINAGSMDGAGVVYGLKDYKLSDGRTLSRLSDTTFSILQTGLQIERV